MACKHCGSPNQGTFTTELSVCYDGLENLRECPIYVCQKGLICLDCGGVDLLIPPTQLEQLKLVLLAPNRRGHSGSTSSLGSQ
jgi:hypothetical protein